MKKILPFTSVFMCAVVTLYFYGAVADSSTGLKALQDPARTEEDKKRDETSKPQSVVPLLNLKAGDVVADIFGGGGYYSEILAAEVGPKGKVLLHNNQAYVDYVGEALSKRMERAPKNIVELHSETGDLKLTANSLDAAIIVIGFHDMYYDDLENGWGPHNKEKFLAQIHRAMKPQGRFVIVDHSAVQGHGSEDSHKLHRIEKSTAIVDIEAAGFKLVAESDALRNPADDLSLGVFDEKIRFHTDRFILAFERP